MKGNLRKTSEEGVSLLWRRMKVSREVEKSEANVAVHADVRGLISGAPSVPAVMCPLLDLAHKGAPLGRERVCVS